CPSRPIRGLLPTASSPPTMPDATRPATSNRITVRLASAFAAKMRRCERTATSRCRQVPSRSSEANTSPATSEVSSGSAQVPEKPRVTSGPAQPVVCIQRPNRVSEGRLLCWLIPKTAIPGPSQQARIRSLTRHGENCLTSSKRYARETGTVLAAGGRAPTAGASAIVAVIGRPPLPALLLRALLLRALLLRVLLPPAPFPLALRLPAP